MGGFTLARQTFEMPKQESLMDMLQKVQQFRGMGLGQQLQQQQIQENTYGMAQRKAINEAYAGAVKIDENGKPTFNTDALTQHLSSAGFGSAVPEILKSMTAYQKEQSDAMEAQNKVQAASKDALGFVGKAIKEAKYDPQLAQTFIEHGLQDPTIQPQAKQQLLQMRQAIAQNPQMVQQVADSFIAQSPKMQELLNAQKVAEIRAEKPTEATLAVDAAKGDPAAQAALGVLQNQKGQVTPALKFQEEQATKRAQFTQSQENQRAQLAQQNRGSQRDDRSYQFTSKQLDDVSKPVSEAVARLGRLQDTLAQNTPQADALVAPELLTVMAGGQGSGLRMNEAEISRIVGGRSNWETLKAAINKWSLDPSKANSITPAQRQQIRSLVGVVANKLQAKRQILDDARQNLINSTSPDDHRRIMFDTRQKLTAIDSQAGNAPGNGSKDFGPAPQGSREGRTGTLPDGTKVIVRGGRLVTQ
jgi:hypothetical protein